MTANVLKQELEKRGAEVVMTQDGTKELSLSGAASDLMERAVEYFHQSALRRVRRRARPARDPRLQRPLLSPQSRCSLGVARDVYAEGSNIRDEGLWRSKGVVCRATQMLALLFETSVFNFARIRRRC